MLEARAGQAGTCVDRAAVAVAGAEELHRVGGEGGGAVEAAVGDPRVGLVLREVLPAHHHRPAERVPGEVVVDVLRGVGLVVGDEAAAAEADVLHERRVAGDGRGPGVRHRDVPEPERPLGVEPERRPVAEPGHRALPDDAVAVDADGGARPGADDLDDLGAGPDAEEQPADAAVEGRALDLADEGAPGGAVVGDGEDAAVRQDADRDAGGVRDAAEAEVVLPRRLEGADGGHRLSPGAGVRPGDSGRDHVARGNPGSRARRGAVTRPGTSERPRRKGSDAPGGRVCTRACRGSRR